MPDLDLLQHLGAWSIETLWIPLIVWTALAGLMWWCLRLWRLVPPLVSYAALLSLLLALPLGVLLSIVTDISVIAIWAPASSSLTVPALPSTLAPQMIIAETAAPSFTWTFLHSLGVLVLGAAVMAGVAFSRLALHSRKLARLRRHLPAMPLPARTQYILNQQIATLDLNVPVQLIATTYDIVPLTFGWWRPVIIIPVSLIDDVEALRLTLLHELVHIRRADYLLQWIGNVVGALFAIHPAVWLLQREIAGCRELACDATVLEQPQISSKRYASLLYRFALVRSDSPPLALSMAASHRELKNRITAMKLRKTTAYRFSPRLVALTLAGLLLGLTTFIVACTDFVGPELQAETTVAKLDNEEVYMVVEEMPELIGGLEALQQDVQYPTIAKRAGIEGRVFIQFVVNAQGKVVNPEVVRGIGAGCDEEALRAVQAATFKPGRQDGQNVPVKMSLPVTFRLNDKASTLQRRLSDEQTDQVTAVLKRQLEEVQAQSAEPRAQKTEAQIKALEMQILHIAEIKRAAQPEQNQVPASNSNTSTLKDRAVKTFAINRQSIDPNTQLRVTSNGETLKEGADFTVDWEKNTISIHNPSYLGADRTISIEQLN